MSSSAGHRQPKCHVLDFFHDDSNSCALTVLQNGVRFHIIADHKNFDQEDESGPAGRVSREYNRLVKTLRSKDEEEQTAAERKHGTSTSSSTHDSGVEVDTSPTASTNIRKGGFQMDNVDIEQELQNWMLSPFGEIFEELAPVSKKRETLTVYEWYHGDTHFFDVKPDESGELEATELESADDLQERMENLMPRINIPKYIQQMDVPHFTIHDLTVTGEAADPDPFHPCLVEDNEGNTYFLKLVDKEQPQPTKRELKLLKRIEDIGLNNSINVPQLRGLVYAADSKKTSKSKQIIGFLQTPITNPTPLVKMLDEDISQRKRDRWAKEVNRIKTLLHDNDIIFGDMKADNFLVDEDDRVWIIDFGGSFTEGWVDPELMETEEGDDMGAEKIVNALKDPVNNTQDTRPDAAPKQKGHEKEKRKFADAGLEDEDGDDEEDDGEAGTEGSSDEEVTEDEGIDDGKNESKAKRRKTEDAATVQKYCICGGPEQGRMVACENESCPTQWFHFECVGLKESPQKNTKWFCEECETED